MSDSYLPGVGSLVRCRGREWVVLPSSGEELMMLRPLAGGEEEVCGIYLPLQELGIDLVEPAVFPPPDPAEAGDANSAGLLFDAARLTLRDGAAPFRSLGRISVRPRAYQFVPLLMALRLDPVRLLIADDVGVGKTIEAGIIARELLDRGDARRLCVLCPPYLCEQWRRELVEKFHLDAVIISSGTVSTLERRMLDPSASVFGYYPYAVVSIDYAKSERHRQNFLANCADLVIVDEAHGAALPSSRSASQQQRHRLLSDLASRDDRHLILLTATPHSGVDESFLSLLAMLDPSFASLDLAALTEKQRDALARHFVQRRRADIVKWMGEDTPFPQRVALEEHYELSPSCRRLFEDVYEFSRELVLTGEGETEYRRRVRYWTALALLRCVMSSPAAAVAAIGKRLQGLEPSGGLTDDEAVSTVYDPEEFEPSDVQPSQVMEEGAAELPHSEERRLRDFAGRADALKGEDDRKIAACAEIVKGLLDEGFSPIVWCRFIATSDYVASELARRLPHARVLSVTGALAPEEREMKVAELAGEGKRVLVATDCLSEGINLQESFDAVVHYDLPWNPNRLEQREGRVDRFGQRSPEVRAVLLYGRDNPVDGAVLEVLLRKARSIHRSLGISVPVPVGSETVVQAVLQSLFFRERDASQLQLFGAEEVSRIGELWDRAVEREKESRTRFAQRAIRPEEVRRDLEATDSVLGEPEAVRDFLVESCGRLGVRVKQGGDGTLIIPSPEGLPEPVRAVLPLGAGALRMAFRHPAPADSVWVGRNHPLVSATARFIMEQALSGRAGAVASRCSAFRTGRVDRRTTLLLLRCRYTLSAPDSPDLLAEEVLPLAFTGSPATGIDWLAEEEVRTLLRQALPDAGVTPSERAEALAESLSWYESLREDIEGILFRRSRQLQDSHRRVREAARVRRRGVRVVRHLPPDLLGLMVLLPIPRGVKA